MGKRGITLVVLAVVAVIGIVLWERHQARQATEDKERAELEAGLRASEVLTAKFQKAAALRVATLSGRVLSKGECESGYFVPNNQSTVAPYRADFFVDLSKVDRASYRWNGTDRIMFVDLPDVTVEPPNIDMSHARSAQSGVFVSRACGLAMQQQVAGRLRAAADNRAHRPDYLAQARESARVTISNLTRLPLAAAGVEGIQVRVRFPFDPVPNDRRWDASRSIYEVLHDPRFAH